MSRRQPPVDGSWRMVEGDNDSFDTTVVNGLDDETFLHSYPSSQYGSSLPPTQQPSQLSHATSSQGSIGDFVARADDERVLMRTPFRPSMPPGASRGGRRISDAAASAYKTPEPEFHMPRMPVGGSSPRRFAHDMDGEASPRARRRKGGNKNMGGKGNLRMEGSGMNDQRTRDFFRPQPQNVVDSWASSGGHFALGAVGEVGNWMLQVVGMALRWTQKPLSIIVAVYMLFGVWTMMSNMLTRSIVVSLQPICRIPGASFLDLPFCGRWGDVKGQAGDDEPDGSSHVEFDELMTVQSQFEQVLERSAEGVSLPLQMRRSETSIRDLRTLVRHSDLPDKEELMHELDGFVSVADQAARDLQYFNTHVGSAVDAVISINRWTARFIDEMAEEQRTMGSGDGPVVTALTWLLPAPLDAWGAWALSPFQPSLVFDEQQLLQRYVENTAMVSERIAGLIVEAQALLIVLTRADDYLDGMHDVVTRQNRQVRYQRDVLTNIWSIFGANRRELDSVRSQLSLLNQVGRHRRTAIEHVKDLIHDLEKMQAELIELRDRVAAPGVMASTAGGGGLRGVPLSVHIETINGGVERLEGARRRMRGQEDDKVREVLAAGGRVDEPRQIGGVVA